MMKLDILKAAIDDLRDIAQKHKALAGANSASNIINKIRNSLELLKTNPYLGKSFNDFPLNDMDFRCLICGVYLCFYKVEKDSVVVHYIVDGRTNYYLQLLR